MNREAINAALFERLVAVGGWKTTSRKVRERDQVDPSDRPYLGLAPGDTQRLTELGAPRLTRLEFVAYVYVHDDSNAGPSVQLNAFLKAIEDALARDSTDPLGLGTERATTLGGLVHGAAVASVMTDEGSYGDQGVALVTIEVLAAG